MVKYCEPFMKKRFHGESISEAKTKALKWVGKNVMCAKGLTNALYHFEKDPQEENCIILVLFVALNEDEMFERHCSICREFHKSFFINENINCNECKVMAYKKRLNDFLKTKKSFYRQELKKRLEGGE